MMAQHQLSLGDLDSGSQNAKWVVHRHTILRMVLQCIWSHLDSDRSVPVVDSRRNSQEAHGERHHTRTMTRVVIAILIAIRRS